MVAGRRRARCKLRASPADWEHIGNGEWGLPDWGIGEEWGREACLWACGAAPARWGRGWRHGGVAARVRANESSTQAGDGRGPRTTPRRVSAWMWMGRRPAHTATGHHLNSHRPTALAQKTLCASPPLLLPRETPVLLPVAERRRCIRRKSAAGRLWTGDSPEPGAGGRGVLGVPRRG